MVHVPTLKEKLAALSIHQRYIYEVIRKNDQLTRKDISSLAGIKISTTIKLVSELIQHGLIKECKTENPILGRKPNSLHLNGDLAYVIGIDIGRTKIRGAMSNVSGESIAESEYAVAHGTGSDRIMEALVGMIARLMEQSGKKDIAGIGIGVSGVIDHKSGTCIYATGFSDFENVPIRDIVSSKFNVPVIVDDTARTHAVGERYYGRGRDVQNFIYVSLGDGIGSGIFMNGSLYRGNSGISGEIGHIVIDRNGPRCRCGSHGCLEKYASGSAIVGQIREALDEGVDSSLQKKTGGRDGTAITAEAVTEAARSNDKLALGVLTKAGENIGRVLASVVSILAPEKIIIGGGVSQAGEFIMEPIRRIIRTESVGLLAQNLEIVISELNEKAGTLGSAQMAIFDFFEGEKIWQLPLH